MQLPTCMHVKRIVCQDCHNTPPPHLHPLPPISPPTPFHYVPHYIIAAALTTRTTRTQPHQSGIDHPPRFDRFSYFSERMEEGWSDPLGEQGGLRYPLLIAPFYARIQPCPRRTTPNRSLLAPLPPYLHYSQHPHQPTRSKSQNPKPGHTRLKILEVMGQRHSLLVKMNTPLPPTLKGTVQSFCECLKPELDHKCG